MLIRDDLHPQQYAMLVAGNLQRQFDLLHDFFEIVKAVPAFRVNASMVKWLHLHATLGIVDLPGGYRDHAVGIKNSKHEPPSFELVNDLMGQYFHKLHSDWDQLDEYRLAAYGLWRLCWIHPFEDGNGRTARAVAWLIICLKLGKWLPGTQTVLEKIKLQSDEYRIALQYADNTAEHGGADLDPLAKILSRHTLEQVSQHVGQYNQS